jgi:hypothetical protein
LTRGDRAFARAFLLLRLLLPSLPPLFRRTAARAKKTIEAGEAAAAAAAVPAAAVAAAAATAELAAVVVCAVLCVAGDWALCRAMLCDAFPQLCAFVELISKAPHHRTMMATTRRRRRGQGTRRPAVKKTRKHPTTKESILSAVCDCPKNIWLLQSWG